MRVKLTYFKEHGKYYTEAEYSTERAYLFEIWAEVELMSRTRGLPGLVKDHSPFIVLVDVPEHPHNHPHLVMP